MTDKDLSKLNRADLLSLLVAQSQEIEHLQERVEKLETLLASRKIVMDRVGNIAEASLELNHIFEDAQKAAEMYLENVCRIADEEFSGSFSKQ